LLPKLQPSDMVMETLSLFRVPAPVLDQTFNQNYDPRPPSSARPENQFLRRHLELTRKEAFISLPEAVALYQERAAPQTPKFLRQHRKRNGSRSRSVPVNPGFAQPTVNSNSRVKSTLGEAAGILTVDTNPDYKVKCMPVPPTLNPRRRNKGEAIVRSTNLPEVNLLRNESWHEPVFHVSQMWDSARYHPKFGFGTKRPDRDTLGTVNRYITEPLEPRGYQAPGRKRKSGSAPARRPVQVNIEPPVPVEIKIVAPTPPASPAPAPEATVDEITVAPKVGIATARVQELQKSESLSMLKAPPSSPGSISTGVPPSPTNSIKQEEEDHSMQEEDPAMESGMKDQLVPQPMKEEASATEKEETSVAEKGPGSTSTVAADVAAGSQVAIPQASDAPSTTASARSSPSPEEEYDDDDFEEFDEEVDKSDWHSDDEDADEDADEAAVTVKDDSALVTVSVAESDGSSSSAKSRSEVVAASTQDQAEDCNSTTPSMPTLEPVGAEPEVDEVDAAESSSPVPMLPADASGISVVSKDSLEPVLVEMKKDSDFKIAYALLGGDLGDIVDPSESMGTEESKELTAEQ